MKIVLVGFMGCGKSAVAGLVAEALQLKVYEMDQMILKISGRTDIPQIFAIDGEPHFRALESQVARELADVEHAVISTGGGALGTAGNLEYFKANQGIVVFLHAGFDTLHARVGADSNRPLFKDLTRARALFEARLPVYMTSADIILDTEGKMPTEVVSALLFELKRRERA